MRFAIRCLPLKRHPPDCRPCAVLRQEPRRREQRPAALPRHGFSPVAASTGAPPPWRLRDCCLHFEAPCQAHRVSAILRRGSNCCWAHGHRRPNLECVERCPAVTPPPNFAAAASLFQTTGLDSGGGGGTQPQHPSPSPQRGVGGWVGAGAEAQSPGTAAGRRAGAQDALQAAQQALLQRMAAHHARSGSAASHTSCGSTPQVGLSANPPSPSFVGKLGGSTSALRCESFASSGAIQCPALQCVQHGCLPERLLCDPCLHGSRHRSAVTRLAGLRRRMLVDWQCRAPPPAAL